MKIWKWTIGTGLVVMLLAGTATAQCHNRELACRIAGAAQSLVNAAEYMNRERLTYDAAMLQGVADRFCACDYSVFKPGSGVLMHQWQNVKIAFQELGPRTTPAEQSAYHQLVRIIGQ